MGSVWLPDQAAGCDFGYGCAAMLLAWLVAEGAVALLAGWAALRCARKALQSRMR